MNKQQAKEKLAELEQKATELRAIIDKPEVKPLFPRSWEEGARFIVDNFGSVVELSSFSHNHLIENLALQGRTFYTSEEAEAFAKRERARAYCLERINEVNEGDNGFKKNGDNYIIDYDHDNGTVEYTWCDLDQGNEACEYIRTREAAEQLINDPEFVEQWKIWKGVE